MIIYGTSARHRRTLHLGRTYALDVALAFVILAHLRIRQPSFRHLRHLRQPKLSPQHQSIRSDVKLRVVR